MPDVCDVIWQNYVLGRDRRGKLYSPISTEGNDSVDTFLQLSPDSLECAWTVPGTLWTDKYCVYALGNYQKLCQDWVYARGLPDCVYRVETMAEA